MGSCSPAEWGLACTGVSRAGERDRSRVEKRSQGRGRKAESLFAGPLALEGGKGRQARAHVPKRNMTFPRLLSSLGKERGTDRNRRATSLRSLPASHQLPLTSRRGVVLASITCKLRHCSRKQCRSITSLRLPSTQTTSSRT